MFLRFVTVALLLVSVLGCGVSKKAERMQKTSDRLDENTRKMRETSENILRQSEHLAKRTNDLEVQMSNKEAYAMLMYNLDRLLGKDENYVQGNEDANLNNEPDLVLYACAAVQSMLFQFWKGDYDEDLAELDHRLELSIEILFTRLFKHIPRDFTIDVMRPTRSYKAVAAVGAYLDETQPRFGRALEQRGMARFSLYDLFVEALRRREDTRRTEKFPKATAKVLQWQQEVEYMLQLRHNTFPMLVVARMTNLQDLGDVGRIGKMLSGWQPDLNKFNPEQLRLWIQWSSKAIKSREDLRSVGITPQYNTSYRRLVTAVDFGQQELIARTRGALEFSWSERDALRYLFADRYFQVQKEMTQ